MKTPVLDDVSHITPSPAGPQAPPGLSPLQRLAAELELLGAPSDLVVACHRAATAPLGTPVAVPVLPPMPDATDLESALDEGHAALAALCQTLEQAIDAPSDLTERVAAWCREELGC